MIARLLISVPSLKSWLQDPTQDEQQEQEK